jgi:hypothetical protein
MLLYDPRKIGRSLSHNPIRGVKTAKIRVIILVLFIILALKAKDKEQFLIGRFTIFVWIF